MRNKLKLVSGGKFQVLFKNLGSVKFDKNIDT